MKTRRLSEIDLARMASLNAGSQLESALRGYNAGGGSWSYEPVRESTSDILQAETPLFGASAKLPWQKIAGQITRACKRGSDQQRANLEVGNLLYQLVSDKGWKAVHFRMGRLPIGVGESLRYWSDVVLEDENGPFIPFFDHRRDNGLNTPGARRIVYSMQNIWTRDRHADLASARLAIVRFPVHRDLRSAVIEFHNESELLTFEELDARVRTVYQTWAQVSDERKMGGTPGTGTGGLF